ncbi:MAG: hypothetical protein U0168_21585 [Nannocystaceae bacterium]
MHLDQAQPGYDGAPLRGWLEQFSKPFEIVRRDTYSRSWSWCPRAKSYCGPCSRMRRGILYDVAERLGCNKIALSLPRRRQRCCSTSSTPASCGQCQQSTTDDGAASSVRWSSAPSRTHRRARARGRLSGLPCNLCGSQDGLRAIA